MSKGEAKKQIQSSKDLQKIQEESAEQILPKQKKVLSASDKIKRKTSNLPDPTHPPMGWKDGKGYDHIFPWIHVPVMHPANHGDTVIFNNPESPANQLILGDNLEVLRTLPSESIDLIYIDPPFFSGRNYNVIWGDTNEVRTFYDIWEGGIDSYLVWLNARLWEMRRVLKKTGSIYIHCDWHASHYIKTEMDKIFGYDNFVNGIIVKRINKNLTKQFDKISSLNRFGDSVLIYKKRKEKKFNTPEKEFFRKGYWHSFKQPADRPTMRYELLGVKINNGQWMWGNDRAMKAVKNYKDYIKNYQDKMTIDEYSINKPNLEFIRLSKAGMPEYFLPPSKNTICDTLWDDVLAYDYSYKYPTAKSEQFMERIIEMGSNQGDVVADFFCGGGTTLAVAMRNKRKFIGCDSSRVAISVTLDRLVKVGEEISGVKSNISTKQRKVSLKKDLFSKEAFQFKLQADEMVEKVPNIEVSYLGVYPTEKFENYPREDFVNFVLTCYGASKNTAEGITDGYRPPAQSEPILIGPSDPKESIDGRIIKKFFDEIKSRLEPNKLVSAKIIGWRFDRQVIEYIRILEKYIEKNNLPLKLELIPLDSKEFRSRILQRYPDVGEVEFFLRFSKAPVIGDIKIKKIKGLEYEFEAIDTLSTNENGWLVNCQWDFDYQEGHFCADKDYILSRGKIKDKKRGEIFKAILKARYKFEKAGEWIIACKVQDNLAGETIISKKIKV